MRWPGARHDPAPLTNALKEQDWTTIVIEFVLLVGGVFVGIQAANRNEARIERELVRGQLSGFPALWDRYGAPDRCRKVGSDDYRCD